MTTPRRDPFADLAETVGKALLEFAEHLRAEPEPTAEPAVAEPGTPNRSKLGATQARILEVLTAAGAAGLTAGQVADQASILPPNAHKSLKALRDRGLATVSDETPALWRAEPEDAS